MKRVISTQSKVSLTSILAMPLVLLSACTSKQPNPTAATKVQAGASRVARNGSPDIDLNCVMQHIQSPPESFHYTFKDESDNPWQEDAEVTPQSVSGTFMNNSLPKPQAFQSPPQQSGPNLMGIGRMASLFSTIHMTSAVVNQGAEQKNGYSAAKYSIDTSRADATEQRLFNTIFGPGGFVKGTVWASSDGCPVQIVLDEELHTKDGSVQGKAHYEEAMVKQ